mgnify:CR=1 FL=1|jgi:hypothetical protein|tara:strand:- start:173 stop:913 length:741 start_codon:yes stop_codon:yes gene_type:complete
MKITPERLRQIITEEVIKEEVSPEDATRTIVALLQGTESKVTADIMGAVYDDMYDPDAGELEPGQEEDFPTEYQPGGGEGDRPTMGFKENLAEIIKEEVSKVLYAINEGCGDDPAQQLADQLGIDIAELMGAMEQMGLDIVSSGIEAGAPMEDDYAGWMDVEDYEEEPMMEMRRFDPTQELGAQETSMKDAPDSVVQQKAAQFFVNLNITDKVVGILINNIAIPDLIDVMDKVSKINTAEEEPPQG